MQEIILTPMTNELKQFIQEEIERLRNSMKPQKQVPIPCPDNMIGCSVFHYRMEDCSEYNQALKDQINHLTNKLKELK